MSGRPPVSPLPMMLALTFSTGVADAVGYLGLDKVFTGNMTGNVVILGMALGGAASLPVGGPALGLGGFVVGAAVGGRALRRSTAGWSSRVSVLLGVVAAALVCLCVGATVGEVSVSRWLGYLVTGCLAAAMGLQASVARHVAVKDVTTVVVTSTLTALAADSPLGSAAGGFWRRRFAAIALILAGALVGALLVRIDLAAGIAASAVITVAVAVTGHLCVRTSARDNP